MSKTHHRRAALVAASSIVALVATTASVPSAQADNDSLGPATLSPTSFNGTSWPASPARYASAKFVTGKIKGAEKGDRLVQLEMKLPSGWRTMGRDRTNGQGEFKIRAKTNWYHNALNIRLDVKPTDTAEGVTSKAHGFAVKPEYRPGGSRSAWSRLSPGDRLQFNACTAVRWRLNDHNAPRGVRPEVRRAVRQLAKSTGIKFVYAGRTRAIPGSDRPWPDNTNMVIAWASPSQTNWDLTGGIIGSGGTVEAAYARNGAGQRVYQIIRSGLVLDNTFRAPSGFRGPNARGSILVHELGHVAGLGHTNEQIQQMYPSARNLRNGIYQAGDLNGLRKVGLTTGCLTLDPTFARGAQSFVPPPMPVVRSASLD